MLWVLLALVCLMVAGWVVMHKYEYHLWLSFIAIAVMAVSAAGVVGVIAYDAGYAAGWHNQFSEVQDLQAELRATKRAVEARDRQLDERLAEMSQLQEELNVASRLLDDERVNTSRMREALVKIAMGEDQ